jgi:hypothetical protein
MGSVRFSSPWIQVFRRKQNFVLLTEKSINSKQYAFLTGILLKKKCPPDFSSLKMAEYRTESADSILAPEHGLACACIIQSGNYYNLCRFRLSKIEINQKGSYSAGSFGGPCRHVDLFHVVFQGYTVCRNTSDGPPRGVSPRCPLMWRFDLFHS